jgi:hypothetical protein
MQQQCPLPNLDFDFSLKNKPRNFNEFKDGGIKNIPPSPKPNPHPPPITLTTKTTPFSLKKQPGQAIILKSYYLSSADTM